MMAGRGVSEAGTTPQKNGSLSSSRRRKKTVLNGSGYISQPELARALMAPPFAVTTLDGKHISLDDLQGKVVLIDFWATWCAPCREALPHVKEIAKKFDGQPSRVLSVSVNGHEQKWKEFVAQNETTWPRYLDHRFAGPVAKSFGVQAIPRTFTIDADRILQDEHIGDAAIEDKLKKLIKRAQEKTGSSNPESLGQWFYGLSMMTTGRGSQGRFA